MSPRSERWSPASRSSPATAEAAIDLGIRQRAAIEAESDPLTLTLVEPVSQQESVDVETLGPLGHGARR